MVVGKIISKLLGKVVLLANRFHSNLVFFNSNILFTVRPQVLSLNSILVDFS